MKGTGSGVSLLREGATTTVDPLPRIQGGKNTPDHLRHVQVMAPREERRSDTRRQLRGRTHGDSGCAIHARDHVLN